MLPLQTGKRRQRFRAEVICLHAIGNLTVRQILRFLHALPGDFEGHRRLPRLSKDWHKFNIERHSERQPISLGSVCSAAFSNSTASLADRRASSVRCSDVRTKARLFFSNARLLVGNRTSSLEIRSSIDRAVVGALASLGIAPCSASPSR